MTENGFAPATIAKNDAITTVEIRAIAGGASLRVNVGFLIGSRRMGNVHFESLTGHPKPQLRWCHLASLKFW